MCDSLTSNLKFTLGRVHLVVSVSFESTHHHSLELDLTHALSNEFEITRSHDSRVEFVGVDGDVGQPAKSGKEHPGVLMKVVLPNTD